MIGNPRTGRSRGEPRIRILCVGLFLGLILLMPRPTLGQGLGENEFRVGAGFNSSEGKIPGIPGVSDSGVHGLGALTRMLSSHLAFRADLWIGAVRDFAGQDGAAFGSSGGIQLGWEMLGTAHYLFGGLDYTHTPLSASGAFFDDFGLNLVYGYELEINNRKIFVEVSRRSFGNVFRGKGESRTVLQVTMGLVL